MADISDVEAALRDAVQAIRDASFPGVPVYRGWPNKADVEAAMAALQPIVTVWQRQGFARNTTRYPLEERDNPGAPPSLTVTVVTDAGTFAGTCSADQIAGVQVGTTAWAVRCTANDTPATIAAALAALSGGTAAGPVLTLAGLVAARTARDVSGVLPTRQQEVGMAVIVWAPTPALRDSIAVAIDAGLSGSPRLALADGSGAYQRWAGTFQTDKSENADLYRRDLFLAVEFSTTQTTVRTPVLFPGATYAPGSLRIGALAP